MWLWLFVTGCKDLTPGEEVLGDEVAAFVVQGPEGFGKAVALHGGRLLASNPLQLGDWRGSMKGLDSSEVRRIGLTDDGPWVWHREGAEILWGEHLDQSSTVGEITSIDRCPDGTFVSTVGVGESVACSQYGVLRTRCEADRCEVQIDDGPVLDEVSPGGAVAWLDDRACWGDPRLEDERAAGRVACDDGLERIGMDGDHLGLSIGGGRAAGRFNRHIVPPRLRIVPLGEGTVWLVDRAAENSRVSLSMDGQHTAVGVPSFRQGPASGRIYVVKQR